MALSFALLAAPLPPASAQSDPTVHDDEISVLVPYRGDRSDDLYYKFSTLTYSADQTKVMDLTYPNVASLAPTSPVVAAAAGRILVPDGDQVVTASRAGQQLALDFPGHGDANTFLNGFAEPPHDSTEFMDIAVSDLDKQPDANGVNHDEVIICYVSADPQNDEQLVVNVAVLNYSGAPANMQPINVQNSKTYFPITTTAYSHDYKDGHALSFDNGVAVTAGDYDGDGYNEIAVAQVSDGNNLYVSTFSYTKWVENDHSTYNLAQESVLTVVPVTEKEGTPHFGGSVDLASGDFNSDGTDDLALASVAWTVTNIPIPGGGTTIYMYPTVQIIGTFGEVHNLYAGGLFVEHKELYPVKEAVRVQVVAGLFVKPAGAAADGRRQLALVFNDTTTDRRPEVVWPFQASDDLQKLTQIAPPVELDIKANQRFGVASGDFGGGPLSGIAVGGWVDDSTYKVALARFSDDQSCKNGFCAGAEFTYNLLGSPDTPKGVRLPLVAYDSEGDAR